MGDDPASGGGEAGIQPLTGRLAEFSGQGFELFDGLRFHANQ